MGIGIHIQNGDETLEVSEVVGVGTSNMAEWTAMVRALEVLLEKCIKKAYIYSDSLLVVNQFNGVWRVAKRHLQPYEQQAKNLASQMIDVKVYWIPRERNKHADLLSKKCLYL
jgi:ribonuclease HI